MKIHIVIASKKVIYIYKMLLLLLIKNFKLQQENVKEAVKK